MIEQDVFFEGGDDGFTGELCLPMEVGSKLIDENTLNEIPYQMEELNQLITVIILSLYFFFWFYRSFSLESKFLMLFFKFFLKLLWRHLARPLLSRNLPRIEERLRQNV